MFPFHLCRPAQAKQVRFVRRFCKLNMNDTVWRIYYLRVFGIVGSKLCKKGHRSHAKLANRTAYRLTMSKCGFITRWLTHYQDSYSPANLRGKV